MAGNFVNVAVGSGYDKVFEFNFDLFVKTYDLPPLPARIKVNHHSDIGLVDAHAESIGSHHDAHLVALPPGLLLVLSYLKIGELRSHFPEVPVLALTASATPEVVDDIMDKLVCRVRRAPT